MQNEKETYSFPERLKEILNNAGWSQEKFADKLGIARPTVSSYVVGKTAPDARTLFNMAQTLNISADYLLGLTDSPATGNAPKTYANLVDLIDRVSDSTGWAVTATVEIDDSERQTAQMLGEEILPDEEIVGYRVCFELGMDTTLYSYYKTVSEVRNALTSVDAETSGSLIDMFKQRQRASELNRPFLEEVTAGPDTLPATPSNEKKEE